MFPRSTPARAGNGKIKKFWLSFREQVRQLEEGRAALLGQANCVDSFTIHLCWWSVQLLPVSLDMGWARRPCPHTAAWRNALFIVQEAKYVPGLGVHQITDLFSEACGHTRATPQWLSLPTRDTKESRFHADCWESLPGPFLWTRRVEGEADSTVRLAGLPDSQLSCI